MTTTNYLSDRTHEVEWSGIRIMFALAEEVPDVVNLGIGQPDFDTPEFIRDAAKKALDEGYTRYPPAKGFADLRRAIARKVKEENGLDADPGTEVYVAVGAMQVIFNTCLHLLNAGDEVIVTDPGYDYYSQIRLFGGVPVPVATHESNGFKVDPADIRAAITSKTKLMILNTPCNPTGAIFDEEILREIADMAIENDIWVLSDEPYEHILFDGRRHTSIGSLEGMAERTISAFTLSKSYAMTGWRVGYTVAPKAVIDEMEKLMEHMVSGVTAVAQRAALAAITAPQDCVREMVATYAKRRELVYDGLNAIDGIGCIKPESTFYAFPNISSCGLSSWDFAKYLVKEHQVAVVPGSIFGKAGEGYVRLSFAASMEQLQEGIDRIGRGVAALKK
ncbi:aminotransferase [Desulfosarcina widdelii]|uniref:Aminotransferase n=1 Tax=Desulfosarcina widdelii TaxID=947919 RepID=A0A5K7Z690_9BACT|nr:pyridoxal phosphate-dependent aminotransferase [Desulfosarcina widdelii]BBO73964.1 aminotransferase [Desulfosarcina widdelii]